jgi:hypothetical protein
VVSTYLKPDWQWQINVIHSWFDQAGSLAAAISTPLDVFPFPITTILSFHTLYTEFQPVFLSTVSFEMEASISFKIV